MKSRFTVKRMAMVGIMAALTFAASQISVNIPTALGNTRLHLGNVMCLLSGLLLGPIDGGLSAGIGSMFYDFTNPIYTPSAPFTLVFKFLMAFVCGIITRRVRSGDISSASRKTGISFFGAACGSLTYVILYLGRNFLENTLFLRTEVQTALIDISQKGIVSGFNGLLAVIAAVPLSFAVRKGLEAAGLFPRSAKR